MTPIYNTSRFPRSGCEAQNQFCCANKDAVPVSYLCDGENDCGDFSDEVGGMFLCLSFCLSVCVSDCGDYCNEKKGIQTQK